MESEANRNRYRLSTKRCRSMSCRTFASWLLTALEAVIYMFSILIHSLGNRTCYREILKEK